jgi:hypothetical protein
MSIFDAAFFKMLFEFAKRNGGLPLPYSPIQYAIVNNKQFTSVSILPSVLLICFFVLKMTIHIEE